MEFDSKNSSILIKKVDQDDVRRSVKYHPSVWEIFLAYVSMEISATEEEELRRQKEMVRKVLAQTPDHSYRKLEFIDAIQRLGVGYHFEEEIDKSLHYIYDTYLEYSTKDDDLRAVALRFRLLRQQGYPISCDVFDKFIDSEGNFKASLIKNIEGMLELFEAAQFRIAGEEVLEKALEFSSSNLEASLPNMSCALSRQVKEALKIPILKSSNRVGAKKFISIYQQNESHSEILLNFAKLDFNFVQKNASERAQRYYEKRQNGSYNKNMPTMEEYMKVAIVTATFMTSSTTSLVGMGNLVTKKDFDWITSEPLFLLASSTICRLTNDMVGYGFEKKPTAVECYMNENGASKEEAFAELEEQVTNAWKDMNQEWLRPTVPVSMPVLTRVLNFTRTAHLFYIEDDEYTNSKANIKNIIHDVLVEPVVTD
ncbi:UNVERIFIED_CONTAM: Bicyclogermacrene synthase [Sesamum calycinum]|uniref:Bicyclogermacrene synthase n=1 Tax=Sesamum calycinum TaxID=2727403 RepID=A0AAW2Q4W9_9LAMI